MDNSIQPKFETVIGLEVHLQFNTVTKIFSGCVNTFGEDPNTCTDPVSIGLPGTLPVLNRIALEYAIKVALALNAQINTLIKFDRKNYFYPDLPKGYQISQYDHPIAQHGFVNIHHQDNVKKIRVHRAHLEEDAGKLIHDSSAKSSYVDYNRSGTPLMEIVTEPDIHSSQEAYDFLTAIKLRLQYLNVSDCDMEKGSLRCDANISIREKGTEKLGTKTEIKNLNSFKAVKMALEYEEARQIKIVQSGHAVVQETRLWDEQKGITTAMRSKEEAHDYRYFPEPDLVPFTVSSEKIAEIQAALPEFPDEKYQRFISEYQITDYDAQILVQDPDLADFFEKCALEYENRKKICNWINGPLLQELNTRKSSIQQLSLQPNQFIALIQRVENGVISNLIGKDTLTMIIDSGNDVDVIIEKQGLAQLSDDKQLEELIDEVLAAHTQVVDEIKQGKNHAMGFLVGQTMKKSAGKANPKKVGEIIKRRLLNE